VFLSHDDRVALDLAAGILKAHGRANLGMRLHQIARRPDRSAQRPQPPQPQQKRPPVVEEVADHYVAVDPVALQQVDQLAAIMHRSHDARDAAQMLAGLLSSLGPELIRQVLDSLWEQ
jgi:hypothetical protein